MRLRERAEKDESMEGRTIIFSLVLSLALFASGAAHADEAKRRGRVARVSARGCAVRL